MRFLLIVLFLVAAIFRSIDATSAASKVKGLSSTNQHDAAPNRMLRTSNLDDAQDQESRGFSFSGLSSLSEKTPKVSGSMAKLWQQIQGKSANAAFALLRVGKADDLFSSKRFSLWAKYMTLVNRKDPEGAMLAILSARYGEKGLAKMLEAAAKAPGASAIVKNLRQNLLQKMKPVSVNNIVKPSNVDDALNKIPVSPSVVKVDDAVPVNPTLNKLDDEADDLFAGLTVHGRDDISHLNPNVINRADDVEVPASPNVFKIDENPTVVGDDFVARYNALLRMDRADDVKIPAGPNRVNDRVNDVPGGGISMVASNLNPNGLKPPTSSNLNKIDDGVEDLPAELSFNGFVRPQT